MQNFSWPSNESRISPVGIEFDDINHSLTRMEIPASVGTSLVDRAATAVVDGTLQQFRYVLDYRDNMTNLRDNLRDLRNSKARVTHMVDEATRRLEEIEADVRTWISRADEAILRVDNILTDDDMANKTCCAGHLPNFKNRYKLSKQAKLEAPSILELTEKGNKFDRVGYHVPLHHQLLPSDDYAAFGSRESTFNSIMEALRDGDNDLIGVWGLGGVGKTTLAKEVGQQMKAEGVFQLVVVAEVHPNADIKTIQERVAEWLQIKKEVKSLDSIELRAALLHKRLLQEKGILVILDDVWDAINLKKVGIPVSGDTNRCTVLVTTRDESLISQMAVQKQKRFRLNVLRDDEASELFQKIVGDIPEDDPVWQGIATQIVKSCGGLPILVLPVATALKDKPMHVWEDALDRLQSGLLKNGDSSQELAYSALELSCSHLGAEQMSLFMFCGLLGPYNIPLSDLVKYTVGLSLFKDCSTVKATRSRVLKLSGDLIGSCLLLEGGYHESFTMHDVVHNFARGYSDHVFSPLDKSVVEEWPDMHTLGQLTHISLRYCQLPDLPARLECPNLKVFLFYGPPSVPSDMFFDACEELRVLDLSDMRLSPFHSSLRRLQNLQTLCLDRCILEDVANIGKMIQLKILSLMDADIVHLPKEIGQLAHIQLLDLSGCIELEKISPGILSCLTHLEELYMRDSFTQWGLRDKSGQHINADLAELKKLKKLTALEIGVTDVKRLPDDLFSDKLERFFIVIGDCWDWSRNDDVSATLKVKLDARIRVLTKVNVLLKKADDLHLDNSVGIKDVDLPELNMEGFGHRLRNLYLQNFHEVRYLVNSRQRGPYIAFPKLEVLVINNAQHLEKICSGPLVGGSLGKLKQIIISSCDALIYVFSLSVAGCLSKLEEIKVKHCEKMEGIFILDKEAADRDEQICLSRLRKLTLNHLPRLDNMLTSMIIQETRKDAVASVSQDNESALPLTFFTEKIVFPNIEYLKVRSIKIHKMWNTEFSRFYSCMRNLVNLKIYGCKFIKDIFTVTMVNSLVQLQRLEIENCRLLREITVPAKHGEQKKICLPKLESLALNQLESLATVCTGDLIECPNLKDLRIYRCPQLKTFITSSGRQPCSGSLFDYKVSFPNLESMTVSGMDSLTLLWDEEIHEDSFTKLKYLDVRKARRLTKLFSSFMLRKVHTLEKLTLWECDSLEEVFDLRDLINESGKYPERISMLTDMKVFILPNLKHVWHGDPHGILSFQNLSRLDFLDCSTLDGLIPASVARQLSQLEELKLCKCPELVQIIYKEERYLQDVYATFVFPSLHRIEFRVALKLSSFYPGEHIIGWPALKHAVIVGCPLLEVFKSELDNSSNVPKEPLLGHQSSMSQPLFSFDQVVTKFESVALGIEEFQMIQKLGFTGVLSSSTLRVIELYNFFGESAKFPINFLERFPNLEKLQVTRCDFVELFTYDLDEEKTIILLSRIQHLDLENVDKLEHIWNPRSKLDRILNNLISLSVWYCGSLIHFAPPSASFFNLTTLSIECCKSLVSLFTFSTMSSLVQVREMTISECEKLTEIIAVSDEVIEGEAPIHLKKLEVLRLYKLGSITSFCSQKNISLMIPLLVELVMDDCPEMEFFSNGYLSAPKLKTVRLPGEQNDTRWKGDLNTTIRQLYTNRTLAKEEENTIEEEEEAALET